MNGLIRASLKNPYAVTVFCMTIVVIGTLCLLMIPVDILPVFKSPAVQVLTFYGGMPAEGIEKDITTRMERWVGQANGMQRQESRSIVGASIVRDYFQGDVDPNGALTQVNSLALASVPNLPPGTLPTLWNDDERYVASYLSAYDGYYSSGDGGYRDEDGYLWVMGRTDDVLNVAGHRLSTGSIEAALAGHEAVAECAVIGVMDELKGQVPRALVVLKSGFDGDVDGDRIRAELVARVRSEVGAVAALRQVDIVAALPKTRSGKILRKTMREIADGGSPPTPPTIEDVSVLTALGPVLRPGS